MAMITQTYTQQQVLAKFGSLFPAWAVQIQGNELMALAPSSLPAGWNMTGKAADALRALSVQLKLTITTQRRAGRLFVTIDLRELAK